MYGKPRRAPSWFGKDITLTSVITEEEDDVEPRTASIPTRVLAAQGKTRLEGWQNAAIAAGALVLVCGLLIFARSWFSRNPTTSEIATPHAIQLKSIAILPFKTSSDSENEYLSSGISDALIARLGNLPQLVVRPGSATRRYAAAGDAVAAGREQGVDAVLDGSVQRSGDRIRVSVQLLRVRDRAVLWAGQFDEPLSDIFALQDSISTQVAQGLTLKLSDEQRRSQRPNPNVLAYQEYLKGRYFWNKRTQESSKKAIQHFAQAIEIDPSYAQAYAGWADGLLFHWGKDLAEVKQTFARSKAALQKAIELDESLAEPHATLGLLAMNVDWDWSEAERQYKRAIELNPNYATAHHWYGEFLAYMGRFDEGLAEIKRAQELDPLSLIISTDLGKVYFLKRDYQQAEAQACLILSVRIRVMRSCYAART